MSVYKQNYVMYFCRSMPSGAMSGINKRESTMSKMVTTVPPCNPFNRIDKMPQKLEMK